MSTSPSSINLDDYELVGPTPKGNKHLYDLKGQPYDRQPIPSRIHKCRPSRLVVDPRQRNKPTVALCACGAGRNLTSSCINWYCRNTRSADTVGIKHPA